MPRSFLIRKLLAMSDNEEEDPTDAPWPDVGELRKDRG
jgi:hypothetical protein